MQLRDDQRNKAPSAAASCVNPLKRVKTYGRSALDGDKRVDGVVRHSQPEVDHSEDGDDTARPQSARRAPEEPPLTQST
jgi:hypothetical protein